MTLESHMRLGTHQGSLSHSLVSIEQWFPRSTIIFMDAVNPYPCFCLSTSAFPFVNYKI